MADQHKHDDEFYSCEKHFPLSGVFSLVIGSMTSGGVQHGADDEHGQARQGHDTGGEKV